MRTRPANDAFDSADYVFETRWNGVRTLAAIERGRVRLRNYRLGDVTARFPELALLRHAAAEQPLLLDGEIVIVDQRGRPDFDSLERRLRLLDDRLIADEASKRPACFLATDVLFRGSQWLLREPLLRRKRILAEVLHRGDCLYLSEAFEGEGHALFQAALDSELDGVIAKPANGPYTPGDFGGGWLTVSHGRRELVVGGYSMQIAGSSRMIELLVGSFDDGGSLIFETAAQLPADEPRRTELFTVMNALQVDEPPFAEAPPFIACWVRPELVVTVDYRRPAGEDEVRCPIVERVRLDVAPDECRLPVDAPPPTPSLAAPRPRLTLLTTLPLPFEPASPALPASRPFLRVVGAD